jgi:cytochrome d ubiquinol oxidase subunit II
MLYFVVFFLWTSLLIYLLLGGADFGIGILELFSDARDRPRIQKAAHEVIGPIWEANHMWLIIAVVILFVGFPQIYAAASIYLHIPLVIMLFGIIARGTSFTFRNYDPVKDNWQRLYNRIFIYSSFVTPLCLGIIAGSAVSQRIDPHALSFTGAYIDGWLNAFSFSIGIFTVAICGFLAAVYLTGQTSNKDDKTALIRMAGQMNLGMGLAGTLIFVAAVIDEVPLYSWVFGNSVGLAAVLISLLSLIGLWRTLYMDKPRSTRLLAGIMVATLLFAVTYAHFPDVILFRDGSRLSLTSASTQPKTIEVLGMALLIGSCFILPALIYLIYTFIKKEKKNNEQIHAG